MDQIKEIQIQPAPQGIVKKGYVSAKTLSTYLDIPVSTIRSWIASKQIPFKKIGYLVRFDLAEIELWIASANPRIQRKDLIGTSL
jgi:excisionase family DNA binding protein